MEVMKYADSGIDERILRAVEEMGFENMTPIQEQAIPVLLEGKDIIGQAQTGTGKTAAFGIPVLQTVNPNSRKLQAVILCPTRELAIQAADEMRRFAKYMHGIKVLPIYGGQDISRQIKALKGGIQIIVGTPGRVMDHMRRHTLKMEEVKLVVLDEADEMLNMGFREDMETILKEMPENHQTALFSATMPKAIMDITNQYQKDAVLVKMVHKELTIPLVKQYYYVVKNIYKEEAASRLLDYYGIKRSLIFCNTKKMVDELAESLKNRGYAAEGLHGDLSQHQRDVVMNRFRNGNLEILIATDVAARGIDVDDVEAVINYDIPQDIEYYVHRIGRTGRAGRQGRSFTFAYGRDCYRIRDIEKACRTKLEERKIPSAEEINMVRVQKALSEAIDTMHKNDLKGMTDVIERKLEQEDCTAAVLAAAFLKLHIGETLQEIPMETRWERKRESGRERRGAGREGRRDMGKDGRRKKTGNGRTEGRSGKTYNSKREDRRYADYHSEKYTNQNRKQVKKKEKSCS